MKKNKLFAPFLMLLAGAVASIVMYCFHYTTKQMLPILLAVLIVFYLAGSFIQKKVVAFMDQIRAEEEKEGEVIEKEAAEEDGENPSDKAAEKEAGKIA